MELRDHWWSPWSDLGVMPAPHLLESLLARYAEPGRHYHTAQHLEECFGRLLPARHLEERPGEVGLALWFHDAIYDTRQPLNEERSAAWAVEALSGSGAAEEVCNRVESLILATRHDARPATPDAALLVDIDLGILGAEQARFDEYELQVRREYAWVPEPFFREARAKVLRGFLAQPAIYSTTFFRERLERQALANLARSLARLDPGEPPV